MSVILFLAVLFTLVLVHEWGHYIVAKLSGMKVEEFGIGFPPKLYGIKKGETEYTLNALPIGGFVRILGEDPAQPDSHEERSFGSKSRLAQALVLIAGVTMNVLFAWLLFVIIFTIGIPSAVDEADAGSDARVVAIQTLPGSPAFNAIPVGSEILSVTVGENTIEDASPSVLVDTIREAGEQPITFTYIHGNSEEAKTLTPEKGVVEGEPDRAALGVLFSYVETTRKPFFQSIKDATFMTADSLRNITIGLYTLITGAIVGTADLDQVAGPIGIMGLVGDAAQFGLTSLLMFTAIISLNLAIINLLPFPALDGGRLLFVAIEAVTKRPINPIWVSRLNTLGFGLLMLLMIVITYNDIVRLL